MSEDIKACPFCPVPTVKMVFNPNGDDAFVECSRCKTQGPSGKNEAEAIAKWNAAYNQLEAKDAEIDKLKQWLKNTLDEAKKRNDEYEEIQHKLNTDLYMAKKRESSSDKRQDELEAEIALLTEVCGNMQGNMLKAQRERDTYLNLLSATEKERDEAKAEIEKWKAEYVRIHQECDAFNRTNEEVFNENRKLKSEYAELRATLNHISDLMLITEKQRDESKKELSKWRDMVIPITAERDEARRVARRLYATNKELTYTFARQPIGDTAYIGYYTRTEPPTNRVDATESDT